MGLFVTIGTVEDRVHRIASSLDKAVTAGRFRYIFGNSAIVDYRDAERVSFKALRADDFALKSIADRLRFDENDDPETMAEEYITNLRKSGQGPAMFTHGFVNIVVELARFVEELGGSATEILDDMVLLDRISDIRYDAADQKAYLTRQFEAAALFREDRRRNRYGDVIRKAKAFIGENYADTEISLAEVAEHVNVSASHFSTIFSQETGQTFIHYLTEIRMENARRLLKTTPERSSEIAYLVGYKDPHYFSFAFKKNVGSTPSDYRKGV